MNYKNPNEADLQGSSKFNPNQEEAQSFGIKRMDAHEYRKNRHFRISFKNNGRTKI